MNNYYNKLKQVLHHVIINNKHYNFMLIKFYFYNYFN